MNFETATLDVLAYHNYNIEDIDWIGCREFCVDIQDFFKAASKSEYDPGYGRPEMPFDLIIMMKDGSWFERREYDGSEWWQYIDVLKEPQITFNFKSTVILFNNNNTEDLIDYVDTTIGGNNGVPAMQN